VVSGLIAPGDVDSRSIADVQPDDLRGYTQCHFFAGIAGWSRALRLAGWVAVSDSEGEHAVALNAEVGETPESLADAGGEQHEGDCAPHQGAISAQFSSAHSIGSQLRHESGRRGWTHGASAPELRPAAEFIKAATPPSTIK
jgi:hypothetical protein